MCMYVHVSVVDGKTGQNTMEISIFFSQPTITVETEVYLYDGISFFGEVGGYMGLYLGFSMLSIYEAAEDFVARFMSKMAGRKKSRPSYLPR